VGSATSSTLSELGGADAVHAVAYSDDGIEIIILCVVFLAISSSSSEFPTN